MGNQEQKIEHCTIVNGVTLTQRAIEFLQSLQRDNNGYLKEVCEELNNTVCMLIDALEKEEDAQNGILDKIKYLNTLSKNFKRLMKP